MLDVQSIIVYLGLAFLLFVIAKYAELTNDKKFVWIIVILLSLVAGLRSMTVGIDTHTYNMVFSIVSSGTVRAMYGMEESFIHICSALLRIWDENQFLFFIFAFISHGLIIFRIWKERELISFRWSVFSYYIMFFSFSLNGMRQYIAVAIIIYATCFIKDGKYVKFLFAVIIAMLFHTSAIIGVLYIIFELIFVKYFNIKRRMTVYLIVLTAGSIGCYLVFQLVNFYAAYFEDKLFSLGMMMIIKLILLIFSIIIVKKPCDKSERYTLASYRCNYFVGIAFNSLSYLFSYMGRIGLYFYVFESIYIGYLFKTKNKTIWVVLIKVIYVSILFYYFYESLTKGPQGELPYRFFWQK